MSNQPGATNSNTAMEQGIAAARAGDKKRALELLVKGLTQDKGNVEGWLWLARLLEDPGLRRKSIQMLLKLDPQNLEAQFMLAELDKLPARTDENSPSVGRGDQPMQPPIVPGSTPASLRGTNLKKHKQTRSAQKITRRLILFGGGGLLVSLLIVGSLITSYQAGWWGGAPTSPPAIATLSSHPQGNSNLYVEYVLDASGSMAEKLPDGVRKVDAAKDQLSKSIQTYRPEANVGLRVYGHRVPEKKAEESCRDIEMIAPLEPGYQGEISNWLQGYQALGMTPIASALQLAVSDFNTDPQRVNSVVLISDGQETCGGDPCALVRQLEKQGVRFTLHVIGLNVDDPTRQQLSCAVREGGGTYQDVSSSQELKTALDNVQVEVVRGSAARMAVTLAPIINPTVAKTTSTPQGLTYINRKFQETGASYTFNIDYPYFSGPEEIANPLNEIIKAKIYGGEIVNFYKTNSRTDLPSFMKPRDFKIEFLGKRVISMWFEWDTYGGGIHPNVDFYTFNYNLDNKKEILIRDLIDESSSMEYLNQIVSYCNKNYPLKSDPMLKEFWDNEIAGIAGGFVGSVYPSQLYIDPKFTIQKNGIMYHNWGNIRMVGNASCLVPYKLLDPYIKNDAPLPPK